MTIECYAVIAVLIVMSGSFFASRRRFAGAVLLPATLVPLCYITAPVIFNRVFKNFDRGAFLFIYNTAGLLLACAVIIFMLFKFDTKKYEKVCAFFSILFSVALFIILINHI
ncbi:MAG: hypothetical protein LBC56_01450 [Oscillospiraceae bacterium]|jgi:hypothetical protein|nr:hypothetical protein [Oscillospiraceae bacterium]